MKPLRICIGCVALSICSQMFAGVERQVSVTANDELTLHRDRVASGRHRRRTATLTAAIQIVYCSREEIRRQLFELEEMAGSAYNQFYIRRFRADFQVIVEATTSDSTWGFVTTSFTHLRVHFLDFSAVCRPAASNT